MKKNRIVIFSLLLLIACLFTACSKKEELKAELKKEIQSDPELLERLFAIVDKVEVK